MLKSIAIILSSSSSLWNSNFSLQLDLFHLQISLQLDLFLLQSKGLVASLFFLHFFLSTSFLHLCHKIVQCFDVERWRSFFFSVLVPSGLIEGSCAGAASTLPVPGATTGAADEGDEFAFVFYFLLLVVFCPPICLRLSIHLGWSFRILQQCIKEKFLCFLSSDLKSVHAAAICTFIHKHGHENFYLQKDHMKDNYLFARNIFTLSSTEQPL